MTMILLFTWLVIQLIGAIRSKDSLNMAIAILGFLLAILHCLGKLSIACL